MHFLLTPVGSSGDVLPYVAIGRELARRGHEVSLATVETFRAECETAGLEFVPAGSREEFDETTRNPDLWHPVRGPRVAIGTSVKYIRRGWEILERTVREDTVLVGHPLAYATRIWEDLHGTPAATLHMAPSSLRSLERPVVLPPDRRLDRWPRWLQALLWRAVDRFFTDPILAPPINELRQELGLPPVRRIFADWIHSPRRVLCLFPAWFAPPPSDWPPQTRLVGFPAYDGEDGAPPEVLEFLAGDDPPVVFTPGSANRHAAGFFAAAVEAGRRIGRRALLLTRYPEQLPHPLPDGVVAARWAPLTAILPRTAAIVHHGGAGTTARGLAAGVPQLVRPLSFDQPDHAARLERLGVGATLQPDRFDGPRVAATLDRLLADPGVARATRRWAEASAADDGIVNAADELESLPGLPANDPTPAGP